MRSKGIMDKLSIYIPDIKKHKEPVQRLMKLGERLDHSVNYLVVKAIME